MRWYKEDFDTASEMVYAFAYSCAENAKIAMAQLLDEHVTAREVV